jgi:hypothetical protein
MASRCHKGPRADRRGLRSWRRRPAASPKPKDLRDGRRRQLGRTADRHKGIGLRAPPAGPGRIESKSPVIRLAENVRFEASAPASRRPPQRGAEACAPERRASSPRSPTGLGMTFIACALANAAVRRGHSALYMRASPRAGIDLGTLHPAPQGFRLDIQQLANPPAALDRRLVAVIAGPFLIQPDRPVPALLVVLARCGHGLQSLCELRASRGSRGGSVDNRSVSNGGDRQDGLASTVGRPCMRASSPAGDIGRAK